MTDGRAGWNVVTSVNDGEAHNMGNDAHLEHDLRYDRADEFMEVVLGHWDAWDDGALIMDKKSGRFADPAKVKRLDHKGKFFKSRGPFTVPRSAQGHPVVIQAGASGRGQRFAGRWGEVIFTAARNVAVAKEGYDGGRNEAAKAGRDPDHMFICNLTTPSAARPRAEAEDKMACHQEAAAEMDALSLLAEALNFDFASKPLDEPLTTEELTSMQGIIGIRDGVLKNSARANPSARDFVTFSGRGQVQDAIVGGPKEIADNMEEMFVERGCDGFVVAATIVPGSYADFVKHVVPEVQQRGLYHKDYTGTTLRENLGLPVPKVGAWKTAASRSRIGDKGHSCVCSNSPPPARPSWGLVEGDRVIESPAIRSANGRRRRATHELKDVKIELPLMPRTFYCAGLNYVKHLKEAADTAGEVPNIPDRAEIGYRAQNALIAHDEDVVIPATPPTKSITRANWSSSSARRQST